MTTPSLHQQTGLSIAYSDPLWLPERRGLIDSLTDQVDSYGHTLQALGDYWQAKFSLKYDQVGAEDWLADGLGRHIEVADNALDTIFEGFVNKIEVRLGGLSITRGPLLDIANQVTAVYSTIDTSISPPVLGIRARTTAVNDTDSRGVYGTVPVVLSIGGATAASAAQIGNMYLAEHARPETSQSLSPGSGSSPALTIEVLGYVHWLNYPYNQTVTTGDINLSAKMTAVITAQLNGLISTDFGRVTANTVQVPAYENDDKIAWSIIKDLVARGDATDQRYLFGIGKGRQVTYGPAPTTPEYQHRLADPEQRIETIIGGEVKPWAVRPGKWIFIPDFLVGKSQSVNLREDLRAIFIESIQYTAPVGLSITGGKLDRLPQRLARLGLAGVGA